MSTTFRDFGEEYRHAMVRLNSTLDSEKIETGRWQCDSGEWHRVGSSCYCNVAMIADEETRTMRLEERKPGQLPALVQAEKVIPPARDRRDTFSYNHGTQIKTF